MKMKRVAQFGIVIGASTLVGCVERTISITSEPRGALVYLNDEEVGRTPVSVPFTYYGVYDVRLEREPEWASVEAAAARYGVSEAQVEEWIVQERIRARETESGGVEVELAWDPLWTTRDAKAPWWETPGPDLVAEAIPNGKAEQKWHFRMYPSPPEGDAPLVDRAGQLRATVVERKATTRPSDGK
jgi:hypothetical protein